MAYDPYYAGQYDNYQDAGYGYDAYGYDSGYGYDAYGYDSGYGYEEPYYTPSPLPAPDRNWVDPVKVNREYLKKIQKSCIHKGFEGLKDDGLFLLEVAARNISLKKYVFDNVESTDEKEKTFMTFVKILDAPFLEVNDAELASSRRTSGEYRTTSVLAYRKSFTNLFQSVYSATGAHDSLIPEVEEEETEGEEQNDNKSKETASSSSKIEKPVENVDENTEEMDKFKIMKGRSVLLPMSGLSMIQKLQRYPLILKVTRCDVTDDDTKVEGEILAACFIRIPETFCRGVLMSCDPATVLPLVVVTTNQHPLVDAQGWEVGEAELTLVLTCFGKGAVNCVSDSDDGSHNYEHPFLLRHLKTKHVVAGDSRPPVDPRLARDIIKLGLFFPSQKTSSEILQHCKSQNLIPEEEMDRKSAKKERDCNWFHMVKEVLPSPSSHSFDFENFMKEAQMEKAALWAKHKRICRNLKTQEPPSTTNFEDRLREVQIVQTGVTGVETQNPFEELARQSISMSVTSYASNLSPN